MSQNDFNIANQGFPATRADINSALQALASTSAGATEPGTIYAYQMWYDETADLLKMRNGDNDAWITLAAFDQATDEWEIRTAVIQAVDSAGVVIKTDDGVARISVADSGAVSIGGNLTVDTNTLFVDAASNNVGIGVSSPSYKLDVSLANDQFILAREASGNITNGFRIAGPNNEPKAIFSSNSATGECRIGGINTNYFQTIYTNNTERLRIDSSGNVGIGTSSPKSDDGGNKLEVSNNANTVVTLTATNDTTPLLNFRSNTVDRLSIQSSSNFGANFLVRSNQDMRFGTNNTERMRIDASGNLLVGTTTQNGAGGLSVSPLGSNGAPFVCWNRAATAVTSTAASFRNGGTDVGLIQYTNTATSYITSSDYRLKEDVQPMVGASDRVLALKPVNFAWKADGSRVDGFLAHEAQEVVPEAVTGEKDAVDKDGKPQYQGIDQSKLLPVVVAALQEALTKIEALEARVAALEA